MFIAFCVARADSLLLEAPAHVAFISVFRHEYVRWITLTEVLI